MSAFKRIALTLLLALCLTGAAGALIGCSTDSPADDAPAEDNCYGDDLPATK